MINLLPEADKRQLRAARSNSLLLRYNILLLCVLGFLGLAIGVTYVYLTTTKNNAQSIITSNGDRVKSYAATEAEAQQFRANLAIAKQILSHDVAYSKAVVSIASLLPKGVVLQNVTLDPTTFGTPSPMIALAKNYDAAIALKSSLQGSPIFSDVHFTSITNTADDKSGYPLTVNLMVTIKKGLEL